MTTTQWWKSVLVTAVLPTLLGGGCLTTATGCNLVDAHVKQMDVLNGLASDVADRLADGAMGQFHAGGAAISPGIEVAGSVTYSATARYIGLSGQFGVAGQGEMGGRESVERTDAIFTAATTANAERRAEAAKLLDELAAALRRQPGGSE